ncbi:hypothetical protein STEG23_036236, partial [Scotinomys teguina]
TSVSQQMVQVVDDSYGSFSKTMLGKGNEAHLVGSDGEVRCSVSGTVKGPVVNGGDLQLGDLGVTTMGAEVISVTDINNQDFVISTGGTRTGALRAESRMCLLSWFLDPGGWSKAATVGLYFIFPGICTLSLTQGTEGIRECSEILAVGQMKTIFTRNRPVDSVDLDEKRLYIIFIESR